MMSVHTILIILCAISYCAAEIASPHWAVDDRETYPQVNRHRHNNRWNLKGEDKPNAQRINYNHRLPIYHYDYGLANRVKNDGLNEKYYSQHEHHVNSNWILPYTTGVFRSYEKGEARIPGPGATVTVLNSDPHQKANKGTITARVFNPLRAHNLMSGKPGYRKRKTCIGCPQNRAVIASKGNKYVILPQPCTTTRWIPISGPWPGSKIPEGAHSLLGRLGHRGKMCRYDYEVIVRHCGMFEVERGHTNCTVDDVWGSKCTVICEEGFDLIGSAALECQDDLKWSSEPPVCKKQIRCSLPQTPDDTKIWCQVPNENDLTGDKLPANTYCHYRADGKHHMITCIDGYWVTKHIRNRRNRNMKRRKFKKWSDKEKTDFPKARVQLLNEHENGAL